MARNISTQIQEEPEKKQRVKIWMGACLVITAVFVDVVQFLLTLVAIGAVLSPIISVGSTFLFWLWFNILGISFITNPKRLATMGVQAVGELIPVVDVLPLLTLGMIMLVIITRSEDSGGIIGKAAGVASVTSGPLKKVA